MSDEQVKVLTDGKVSDAEDVQSNEEVENDVKDATNKKKKKKKRNKGEKCDENKFSRNSLEARMQSFDCYKLN